MKREFMETAWVWLVCLALAALKLWLTAGQTVSAIGPSDYDDWHFLTQAQSILRGQWLGAYSQLTLIKGPFFPAWIAFAFLAGIPLLLSVQLLYALACWLFAAAVKPLLKRTIYTPVLYGALLFSPESTDALRTRLIPQMITPALTLLVAACAFGLLLRQGRANGRSRAWAVGLGVSLAALWLSREEGALYVLFILFVVGSSVWLAWKRKAAGELRAVFQTWVVAALVWGAIMFSVAANNYLHYGVFLETDLYSARFTAAYGALSRVMPAEFKPLVPVAKKTREQIYTVSPAFRELKPFLEGASGNRWETYSEAQQDASNRHEILGGWFAWALRDAVSEAGYYASAATADAYYGRLARQVNAACDEHLLDCYPSRATLLPVWHFAYIRPWLMSFEDKLTEVATFTSIGLDPNPSVGSAARLALFRDITRNHLTPVAPAQGDVEQGQAPSLQHVILGLILRAYQLLNPAVAVVGLMLYGYFSMELIRKHVGAEWWIALTGCLILFFSRLALISLLDITTLHVGPGGYVQEAYPAMLAFTSLACLHALDHIHGWSGLRARRP